MLSVWKQLLTFYLKLKILLTDNGVEFWNKIMKIYLFKKIILKILLEVL